MSRLHAIQSLTQALRKATEDHNWPAVLSTDASIAELLTALRGKNLDAAESLALATLKKLYQQVRDYCQNQSDIVAEKMNLASRNREGTMAYALFMDEGEMR